jgi:hypothetical protein
VSIFGAFFLSLNLDLSILLARKNCSEILFSLKGHLGLGPKGLEIVAAMVQVPAKGLEFGDWSWRAKGRKTVLAHERKKLLKCWDDLATL